MNPAMFHLAFPVRDLESSQSFYVDLLGASVGRATDAWLDILLWGAQITLHERPDDVPDSSGHGVRHFGATLDWDEWERVAQLLTERQTTFVAPPKISLVGTPKEQAKLMIEDPSGNRIELKAYRNPAAALQY